MAEDTVDGGQGNSPFDGGNGVAVAQSIGAGLGAVDTGAAHDCVDVARRGAAAGGPEGSARPLTVNFCTNLVRTLDMKIEFRLRIDVGDGEHPPTARTNDGLAV